MQTETEAENAERVKLGYEPTKLIGWASAPFYDQNLKVLHWAKEIQFGDATTHTLNYNLRVLGRKGVFILNAVASMEQFPDVTSHIDPMIRSVTFDEGYQYADFSPDVDQVAAWTIGGLVAGKVLAKVGFFALLVKFWKVIALGAVALGSGIWKYIRRKREEPTATEDTPTA